MATGSRKAWTFVIGLKETLQQNRGMVFVRNLCQSCSHLILYYSHFICGWIFFYFFIYLINKHRFCSSVYVCHVVEVSMRQHVNFSEEQSGSWALTLLVDVVWFKSMDSTLQTPAVEIEQRQRTHETLKKTTIRTTWRNTKRDPDRMNRRIKDRNSNNEYEFRVKRYCNK